MFNREQYFQKTPWTWKHVLLLLFMVLVLIPFFIEYLLKQYLLEIFQNELYAGTLVGFIMSIIFTIVLYVIAIKTLKLDWTHVGLRHFPKKYWLSVIGWTLVVIISSIFIVIIMEVLISVGTENQKPQVFNQR